MEVTAALCSRESRLQPSKNRLQHGAIGGLSDHVPSATFESRLTRAAWALSPDPMDALALFRAPLLYGHENVSRCHWVRHSTSRTSR